MMSRMVIVLGVVLAGSAVHAQMGQGKEHPVLRACKSDIARFCSNVAPGEGRVKACMKQHLPELSEPCKEALFQAWLRD